MAKPCNTAPAFFRAQPKGTGWNFTDPLLLATCRAYSLALLGGSCLVPPEIHNHRGGRETVLTGLKEALNTSSPSARLLKSG